MFNVFKRTYNEQYKEIKAKIIHKNKKQDTKVETIKQYYV